MCLSSHWSVRERATDRPQTLIRQYNVLFESRQIEKIYGFLYIKKNQVEIVADALLKVFEK